MMQEYGTVTAQIVTSAAQIPIPGATLTITQRVAGRQAGAAGRAHDELRRLYRAL